MDARIVDVASETEATFFRCLHDEKPQDPRAAALRRKWHDLHKDKGLREKVLLLESGEVAGLCQYIPIEHSPFLGRELMAILCIWVHGYDHLVGNQQKKGFGRLILDAIEADARESGMKGVAAWGKDFPYWNPVSFYEHMGYVRADAEGQTILVWKRFSADAEAPKLMRLKRPPVPGDRKVDVTVFVSGWCCGGCEYALTARDAVQGLEDVAHYNEIDTSERETQLEYGAGLAGIYLDGEPFRPDGPPFTTEELTAEIRKLYQRKTGQQADSGAA
jgi:N-acetylglutamate synthase-like GNAT family acetyltransferase